jgi:hypothetical protein
MPRFLADRYLVVRRRVSLGCFRLQVFGWLNGLLGLGLRLRRLN